MWSCSYGLRFDAGEVHEIKGDSCVDGFEIEE